MARKTHEERHLFISDLQIPFENEGALEFCKELKKTFKIPTENIYCVGDEVDQYFGSMYEKSCEAEHTPNSELEESLYKLGQWQRAFPRLKTAVSNHGIRYWRKALEAGIPKVLMREYREVLQAPRGWEWDKYYEISSKFPMLMEHGDDWGGQAPHRTAAIHNGVSTVMGHHHSLAAVDHIKTKGLDVWGMVVGCLIDRDAYAFEYSKKAKRKPVLGAGIVLDSGRTPVFIPLE